MVLVGIAFLRAPCRVVYVIDEPDVRGFGYGTLPGHPVSGEERRERRPTDRQQRGRRGRRKRGRHFSERSSVRIRG
ncbi:hypothetical protein BN9982_740001 [Mycobacterium tuberculosis]|nr:hypothetical protein BN9982_740001 [Mycobacterium tuberculosis]